MPPVSIQKLKACKAGQASIDARKAARHEKRIQDIDKGNLLSPYLQNKALNFINSSFYKSSQDSDSLIQKNKVLQKQITQLEHLNTKKSQIHAAAQKPIPSDFRSVKAGIQAIFMKNKHQYTTCFINLATQEISEIHVNKMLNQSNCSEYFIFGIAADESTRELRIRKRQWQIELTNDSISIKENLNNSDSVRERSANKLFEDLF
ncbi:11115_t:CDS:2, partial [Gigaspora margarita]